ncbi:MAG: hypothetical protein RLZZ301_1281 [Bacteroidota bacterium]|jgi:hypothetical protein
MGIFFAQTMNQLSPILGAFVVISALIFAGFIGFTDVFPMESWRKQILVSVLIAYGIYRGYRVYLQFKHHQKK